MHIDINGYNICYKESGNGSDVVVILQGWGTSMKLYDPVAEILSNRYRVIQFDLPGFGESDEPKEPWNVDAFGDFFCNFMEALNVKKACLIGHSYGGRIIIKLCARRNLPFEISRIVLIDSAGILPVKSFKQQLKIREYKALKRLFDNKIVYALFPELVDDWKSRQGSADYRNATPMMRKCLVMAVNEDLSGLLPLIKQDTLIIWGDMDTATPISDAKIMNDRIESSGLVVLEGAGHFSFLEKPALFRNVMQSYFQIGAAQ
ncbi:MAG: alpha/beta hydrolase [Lachnospiraceae bacterium]|nr:alpha/beta hydrolase [Lachnospiraceae bacterium]